VNPPVGTETDATRAALYMRTSTLDQTPENQAIELRKYAEARGWKSIEFVDQISGVKESRPGLDRLVAAARRRQFDVIVIWDLSRLGRSLSHLLRLIEEWQALGISLVSLRDGLDLSTPSGRLQMHILGALATFERERLRERVIAGLARAKANGKRLGRQPYDIPDDRFETVSGLSLREAAKTLGVSRSVVHRWRLSKRAA
jgi:DNA invertase Pin-like site-specific DNA recombinase